MQVWDEFLSTFDSKGIENRELCKRFYAYLFNNDMLKDEEDKRDLALYRASLRAKFVTEKPVAKLEVTFEATQPAPTPVVEKAETVVPAETSAKKKKKDKQM